MKYRLIRVVGTDSSLSAEYDKPEDAMEDVFKGTSEWEWEKNPNGSVKNILTGALYYLMDSEKAARAFNLVN